MGDNARLDGFDTRDNINFEIQYTSGFYVLAHFGMKIEIQRKITQSDAIRSGPSDHGIRSRAMIKSAIGGPQ